MVWCESSTRASCFKAAFSSGVSGPISRNRGTQQASDTRIDPFGSSCKQWDLTFPSQRSEVSRTAQYISTRRRRDEVPLFVGVEP